MTYPDAHIEHWGRVYRRAVELHGRVRFERFIARPDVYLSGERAQRLAHCDAHTPPRRTTTTTDGSDTNE